MRKVELENNKYYHIYNRGVDKRDVFLDKLDYIRFLRSMKKFNSISAQVRYLKEGIKQLQ